MSHSKHISDSGVQLPSVSQIPTIFSKDLTGFESWICKQRHPPHLECCISDRNKFYKESADLGNDIHALREAFLKGENFSEGVPEYQAKIFDPIAKFYKNSGYKPMFIEEKLTGKEFGGTLDGAGTFTMRFWDEVHNPWSKETKEHFKEVDPGDIISVDDIWIEDLKIKSKLDITHPLQLFGYSLLLKEVKGVEANWGLIIRREKKLDKHPELQLKGYYLPAYKDIWNNAFECWKYLNG